MPVFDFNNTPDKDKLVDLYLYNLPLPTNPPLHRNARCWCWIIRRRQWKHHSSGCLYQSSETDDLLNLRRKTVSSVRGHPADRCPFCQSVKMARRAIIFMSGCPVRTEKMGMPFIRSVRSLSVAAPNFRRRMVFYSL